MDDIGTGYVHKTFNDCGFRENRRGDTHIWFRGVNEFLCVISTFIARLVHLMMLSIREVRENRCCEGHSSIMGMNEITFKRVP